MTVNLVMPGELAMKIFGMYLFETQGSVDLSEFGEDGIFFDEIERGLLALDVADQRAASARFEEALGGRHDILPT